MIPGVSDLRGTPVGSVMCDRNSTTCDHASRGGGGGSEAPSFAAKKSDGETPKTEEM